MLPRREGTLGRFELPSFSFPSFIFPVSFFHILPVEVAADEPPLLPSMLGANPLDGGVTGPPRLELADEDENDLLTISGTRKGVEDGVVLGSSEPSSLMDTVLDIFIGRGMDAEATLVLPVEREFRFPPHFSEPSLASCSSISNTPTSVTAIGRSGCIRVGEADCEYKECVGEAVGVKFMVEAKSHESAGGLEVTDACLRRSWRSTSGGSPTEMSVSHYIQ